MDRPLLSVIIPTHNRRELVQRAIRSVLLEPEASRVEILLIDDHSTDGTLEALAGAFAQQIEGGNLVLLRSESRADPGASRNEAARKARAEYLAFLDSDDMWLPGRVGKILALLGQFDFAGTYTGGTTGDPLRSGLQRNEGITSATVIKRGLFFQVGGFPEGYFGPKKGFTRGFEDYELWLRCLTHLAGSGRLDRFRALDPADVRLETTPAGAGRLQLREQMRRELFTVLKVFPKLPAPYRLLALKRLLGALKGTAVGIFR